MFRRDISPLRLIQETVPKDEWQLLVCCLLLNRTTGRQVIGVLDELFQLWPTPELMADADQERLSAVIRPLGFQNRRADKLVRFSREWLGVWQDVSELHGVGPYARDSYAIFVEGRTDLHPDDAKLKEYLEWVNRAET